MTGPFDVKQDLRILLVDDDQLDRMGISRALRQGGIQAEICEAVDATRGLEILCEQKVDCAFIDYYMPGEDGLWLVREVRSRGIRTPIIFLTGQGDEQTAVELMKAGAADYLSKANVTPERVTASLRQTLRVARAEEALRQSEERLRLAVDGTHLGTWDFNLATGELNTSPRCQELFGIPSPAEATYDAFVAAIHPDDRERTTLWVAQALDPARGGSFDTECRVLGANDGDERWVRANGRAFFDARGRAMRFVGTVQDIGDHKRIEAERARLFEAERVARERAEAASRMREDMVAIVSHDLRNPLSAIMNSAFLLRATALGDGASRAAKQVETIARSADRMKRLISDLLDIASIEGGRLFVEPTLQDARALVTETLEMLQPVASEKSLCLETTDIASSLLVQADSERLLQVLSNLVGNAIKFTPEGGTIRVGAEREGEWVRFAVADNGRGISDEHMQNLFDRYWQARRDGRHGIGLGLSIAKGIIDAHGGKIWAESKVGAGTTFYFLLRAAEGDAERRTPVNDVGEVLVVDDDEDVRLTIRDALTDIGYRVFTASDGEEALERLRARSAHVILLDLEMPRMTGAEFRSLQKNDPRLAAIPVVLISGQDMSGREGLLDVAARVAKPVELELLHDVVRRLCAQGPSDGVKH